MRRTRLALIIASAGLLAAGLAPAAGCSRSGGTNATENQPAGEPGKYLADFDRAWELVRDTHYDENYNGVDWNAVRDELRPRAEMARTRPEMRALINEMVGRLNQSHFGIIPQEVETPGAMIETEAADSGDGSATPEIPTGDGDGNADPGIDFRVIDGRATVTAIRSGSAAERAGVRTGWVIGKIRDRDITAIISDLAEAVGEHTSQLYALQTIESMIDGRPGTPTEITFLDGADAERTLELMRNDPPGMPVKFGNLPTINTHFEHRWLTPEETGDPDTKVGYIAFNIFMIPVAPQFERAMYEFKDADGVIIDLRGNPGGVGAMAGALGRFFVTEKQNLGIMSMRGAELQFNAEPVAVTSAGERLPPFTGPVAMLIDPTSASTSEVFAGGMRAIGRITTFGQRTAGMALPAAMDRLPSGDVLLHAIADYVNSDGTRLEGDGVPADVEVPLNRNDLLDGIDAPLREAAHWIVNQTAAQPTANEN
jgi:carboxyl-terminal processing protease